MTTTGTVRKTLMVILSILLVCLMEFFFIDRLKQVQYPNLPLPIPCLSYEPMTGSRQIGPDNHLTEEQIRNDFKLISKYSKCIHTYYMVYGMEQAPKIANEFGIKVIAGIWLGEDEDRNRKEMDSAKKVLRENKNIILLVVGNETQLFKTLSLKNLLQYIAEAKKFSPVPVSTDEFIGFWLGHPEAVQKVDFIGLHIFPYWDGDPVEYAVWNMTRKYNQVVRKYPTRKVYLTETGWPTDGNKRWGAEPSLLNERRFLNELNSKRKSFAGFYNIVEAFDQPWKIQETEGRAGAHWGILDAQGEDKVDENSRDLSWAILAAVVTSFLINSFFSIRYRKLKFEAHFLGHWFFALIVTSVVWIILTLNTEYFLSYPIVWAVLMPSQILLIFIIISHFIQALRIYGQDPAISVLPLQSEKRPFISIHIPCCNEDPYQVIACATSCLNQDYPNFEVIVIDNNTSDPRLWQPIEAFARGKERVKFIHVEKIKGFKAGALNLALKHIDPKTEAIAVVDSDYVVYPDWLTKTVPYLSDKVKVVQSPQSYRVQTDSLFERAVILEQKIFFEIGMRIRNTANAIIEHGTMCIIDLKTLKQVGQWSEWCITEDTELGLRIICAGHQVFYLPTIFGGGIAPKSFFEYTKQRSRWVFGSVRMALKYFKDFTFRQRLSFKQKYYFISGWIFWFAHLFYPIFVAGAFVGTTIVLKEERLFPPLELSITLIIFVALEILITFLLVKKTTKSKLIDILGVIMLGMSITYTISMSVFEGLFYKDKPFRITNKNAVAQTWQQLTSKIIWSLLLFSGYMFLIHLLVSRYSMENFDILIWVVGICLLSSIPIAVVLIETLSFYQSRQK